MTPTDPSGPVRGSAGQPAAPAEESSPTSLVAPPTPGRWVWARDALREQAGATTTEGRGRVRRRTGSGDARNEVSTPNAAGPGHGGPSEQPHRVGSGQDAHSGGPGAGVERDAAHESRLPTVADGTTGTGPGAEAAQGPVPSGGSLPDVDARIAGYEDLLLGGRPSLTARELAERTGTPLGRVDEFWLAMGFRTVGPDEVAFTVRDLEAYGAWSTLIDSGAIDLATGRSLLRAQSHISDRLALWQVEALVEDVARRQDLDDTQARRHVLENMGDRVDFLEHALVYSWRRQLESLIARVDHEVTQRGPDSGKRRFPLTRSLGFVDMVSYTSSSTILGSKLVGLIERFEDASRTAVTASGGRVVKMIGDAVLFIADDLTTGLRVVTSLIEALGADDQILPVRASFVRGDVFSRSGDVFGPPVNLASRLVDIAPEGRILTDATTAAAIAGGKGGSGYHLEDFPSAELRGFGTVSPYLLARDLD